MSMHVVSSVWIPVSTVLFSIHMYRRLHSHEKRTSRKIRTKRTWHEIKYSFLNSISLLLFLQWNAKHSERNECEISTMNSTCFSFYLMGLAHNSVACSLQWSHSLNLQKRSSFVECSCGVWLCLSIWIWGYIPYHNTSKLNYNTNRVKTNTFTCTFLWCGFYDVVIVVVVASPSYTRIVCERVSVRRVYVRGNWRNPAQFRWIRITWWNSFIHIIFHRRAHNERSRNFPVEFQCVQSSDKRFG